MKKIEVRNQENNKPDPEDIVLEKIMASKEINLETATVKDLKIFIKKKVIEANPLAEEWQSHYAVERIIEKIEERLHPGQENRMPLDWFNFYIYFRLPAGIVISTLSIFLGGLMASFSMSMVNIAISGSLFWGLKERKLWAWKMNFIILILDTIVHPLQFNGFLGWIIGVIIFGLVWLLPNWIYFKKRKYLFLNSRRLK